MLNLFVFVSFSDYGFFNHNTRFHFDNYNFSTHAQNLDEHKRNI